MTAPKGAWAPRGEEGWMKQVQAGVAKCMRSVTQSSLR
jgi:hypothetical protein